MTRATFRKATLEEGLCGVFGHVSTGGEVALAFLKGDELPGLAALPDR